jgi:hypothetical protein
MIILTADPRSLTSDCSASGSVDRGNLGNKSSSPNRILVKGVAFCSGESGLAATI